MIVHLQANGLEARLSIASVLPTTEQQLANERIALFAQMSTGRSHKMPMT
jgi:hypothetical protein